MFGNTPLLMVEDQDTLNQVAERLRGAPVIGVDTESDSFHHYQEKVCLVQISDAEQDYIVDPLAVPNLSPLADVFADPQTVKVLHGADYDVVCLKRDFDLPISNIFDTMLASLFLGLPRIGLADLIGRFFGHKIDKKYQRHDWALRPLLPEHLQYARGDTHWLLALQEVLTYRLKQRGKIGALMEECAILETREWSGRLDDPGRFLKIKKSGTLDERGQKVLRALWQYREAEAVRLDRPPFKVLADAVLLQFAQTQPVDLASLQSEFRQGSQLVRRHGAGIVRAVQLGKEDEEPLPKAKKKGPKTKRSNRRDGPGVEKVFLRLKNWRNEITQTKGLNPVVVVNNALLREIAKAAPASSEELGNVEGMRDWQMASYGDAILEVLAEIKMPVRQKRKKPTT